MGILAGLVKPGQIIQMVGGNPYLSVVFAILVSHNGAAYCTDHGKRLVEAAGFEHLFPSERLVFVKYSKAGSAEGAPYDAIFVKESTFNEKASSFLSQLGPGGKIFDLFDGRCLS